MIHGSTKATIDVYRSSTAYRHVVNTSPTFTNKVYTMAVAILGTKPAAAKGTDVAIDRISVR